MKKIIAALAVVIGLGAVTPAFAQVHHYHHHHRHHRHHHVVHH